MHSPLGNHEDLAGQIGTGHGKLIATLQLFGDKSYVFIQELPSVVAKYGRPGLTIWFEVETGDLWGLRDQSCYLTAHGVYASTVP